MMNIEEIKSAYRCVFKDSSEFTDAFMDSFFSEERYVFIETDGKIAAFAFVIDIGSILPDEKKVGYIYAVGVLPQYRGLGLGIAVTNKAVIICEKLGLIPLLCPADSGLFDFYAKHCGFVPCFTACKKEYQYQMPEKKTSVKTISASEYSGLRDILLSGNSYIKTSEKALSLFRSGGGSLLSFSSGIAACEKSEEILLIKELISDDANIAVETLCAYFGCKKAIVYSFEKNCGQNRIMSYGEQLSDMPFGIVLD